MSLRYTAPYFEWIDGDGVPLAGGKLYFYASGTSTPLATYSNSALTVPNANPVVANADGFWGPIFLQAVDYKVVLKTSADVEVWTADPIAGGSSASQSGNIRTVTASGNILITDGTVLVNSATATTQNLPSPAAATGLKFTLKNINIGVVTVVATIDGLTNYALGFLNQSVTVQSNGTTYYAVE